MNQISVERLYELYLDTSKRCLSCVCNQSDENLGYDLFEQFDVGVTSDFHDDSLQRLHNAGMISHEAVVISQNIRKFWFDLDPYSYELNEIRSHPKWKQLFSMCDALQVALTS